MINFVQIFPKDKFPIWPRLKYLRRKSPLYMLLIFHLISQAYSADSNKRMGRRILTTTNNKSLEKVNPSSCRQYKPVEIKEMRDSGTKNLAFDILTAIDPLLALVLSGEIKFKSTDHPDTSNEKCGRKDKKKYILDRKTNLDCENKETPAEIVNGSETKAVPNETIGFRIRRFFRVRISD